MSKQPKQTSSPAWWFLAAGLFLLLLAAVVLTIRGGHILSASGPPAAGSPAATRQAAILTEEARPPAQATPLPATPPAVLTRLAAPPSEPAVFAPIPGSTPAGDGAIVQVAPPFSGSEYHIENEWYQDVDGGRRRIFVFAGSVSGPGGEMTEQGVVIVQVWQMPGREGGAAVETVESTAYLTPVEAGPVRITGAAAGRLILQTPDGRTFYFDVPGRQFMPSLDEPAPAP